jgi:hypothetical protein
MTRSERRQLAALRHTTRLVLMYEVLAFGSIGLFFAVVAMWVWLILPVIQ